MGVGIAIGIAATGKSGSREFNEPAIAGSFFYLLHVISNASPMMTIMCLMPATRTSFRSNLWP